MYPCAKRFADILLAAVGLVILAPLLILIAVAVQFDGTRGGICALIPKRVGKRGVEFAMYKFRTMYPKARKGGGKVTSSDPRVTKVGRFLRATDLDELPQLINVVLGQMSIVGPRPYFASELEDLRTKLPDGTRLVDAVLSVRPGMTGMWQVSGRNDIDLAQRIRLDAKYVSNANVLIDLVILMKTPWVVMSRRGAC